MCLLQINTGEVLRNSYLELEVLAIVAISDCFDLQHKYIIFEVDNIIISYQTVSIKLLLKIPQNSLKS